MDSQDAQRTPKKILVTGADGALGGAVVKRFLKANCEVLATYLKQPGKPENLQPEHLRDVKVTESNANPTKYGDANWIQMDLTDSSSVKNGVASIGSIDALIHCAGGFRFLKVDETDDESLNFLFNTNLKSAFLLSREVLPSMKKKNFGRIVFISSRSTFNPPAGMAAYTASKAGINMLTASLADEVRSFNINVNAVLPTVLNTPANQKDMPKADFSSWVPLDELAEIIFMLTQPWGKSINGALIPVAGRL